MNFSKMFKTDDGKNYVFTFALICILFLLWGACNGMLDVLNKHFQNSLHINKAQSALIQFANYMGYFLMAIPAGLLARRFGYKTGIMVGLSLITVGSFWFIPATMINTFPAFLLGLFTIAIGLACLETVANPYTTVLGAPETGAARINLAQSCNGIGWIIGPLLGNVFLSSTAVANASNAKLSIPYIGIGIAVLIIIVIFSLSKVPDIHADEEVKSNSNADAEKVMWRIPFGGVIAALILPTLMVIAGCFAMKQLPSTMVVMIVILLFPVAIIAVARKLHFSLGVVAQFLYVAAQTGVFSFFINYVVENMPGTSDSMAAKILAFGGFGLFFIGRFSAGFILQKLKPQKALTVYSFANVALMVVVIVATGKLGAAALIGTFFFMSIMFPTIFALGIHGLGEHTKQGSSIIVMAILGGAIAPMLMGKIADAHNMRVGFIIPLVGFVLVGLYAAMWKTLKEKDVKIGTQNQ